MNSRAFRLCAAMSLLAALAITVQVPANAGEIHFTPLNDPNQGPAGTAGNVINDLGVVGGNYANADGSVYYGFVATPPYSKESFTTVGVPGAVTTNIWGINLEGVVAGNSLDMSGVHHGFVSHPPYTTVTTLDAPGACSSGTACPGLGTLSFNINLEGVIAGTYFDANDITHGYVTHPPYTKTTFTTIDVPGACSSGTACSGLGTIILYFALNDLGAVTGYFFDASQVVHGFVSYPPYGKTNVTTFDAPGACSSGTACAFEGTVPASINLWGVITGTYYGADGIGHGFVSYPPYTKTTFTAFDPAASVNTQPVSINLEGVVAGSFADAVGVYHGFVSHPPYTTVTTFDAPGACSSDRNAACVGNGTFPNGINVEGVFAGVAYDATGVDRHGFVAQQ
jgi:hypothetical protein